MWQRLQTELADTNFQVVAVAEDVLPAAARPWIEAANPTYPNLIDSQHVLAELYGMLNVPMAVWIDEEGRIVRPPETAGSSDEFRSMDRQTFKMTEEATARLRHRRGVYVDALRDWARNGAASPSVLPAEEVRRRLEGPGEEQARATAWFRLGSHLAAEGHAGDARAAFDEALRLWPESWSIRRQAWALEDPAKAGGPEFWAAVDALGERRYYPEVDLPGFAPPE